MKRRLCAFLVFALCVSCLAGTAMAADESLHTDYVPITEDGFVADSMDGVDAIYNLTIASPDCLNYVQRYYREVYGLELQATGHDIWITNSSAYYFVKTSDPQPGDIGYASASEREKGNGHYVMCKSVNEAAGTITLIEQNWIWNGQAGVNRTKQDDILCLAVAELLCRFGGVDHRNGCARLLQLFDGVMRLRPVAPKNDGVPPPK